MSESSSKLSDSSITSRALSASSINLAANETTMEPPVNESPPHLNELQKALEDVIKEYSKTASLLEKSLPPVPGAVGAHLPHTQGPDSHLLRDYEATLQSHMQKCLKKLRKATRILENNPAVFNYHIPVGVINHLDKPRPKPPASQLPATPQDVFAAQLGLSKLSTVKDAQTQAEHSPAKAHNTTKEGKEDTPHSLLVTSGGDPRSWLTELTSAVREENDAARGELLTLQSLSDTFEVLLSFADTGTPLNSDSAPKTNIINTQAEDLRGALHLSRAATCDKTVKQERNT